MKTFHCDHCENRLVFENVLCLRCERTLGYLPDAGTLTPLTPVGNDEWEPLTPAARHQRYRMCANYKDEAVCNWMVPAHDSHPLCLACRLNRTIPNLNDPENEDRWAKVEAAKRRMVYTLLSLGLPVVDKETDPIHGIAFEFLVDQPGGQRVLTGHDEGVITINVAEAEAHIREKMRKDMGEKYRTLLGHFRHEIGHHYWNVLIRDGTQIDSFRRLFGDERLDYAEALRRNYEKPPSNDWDEHYISAYASCHPWEDWAETWGNYLHMIDTLETARDARIILEDAPFRSDEPSLVPGSGCRRVFRRFAVCLVSADLRVE
jgi:hypothetical protein